MPGVEPGIRTLLTELKLGLTKIYHSRLRGMYVFGSYARGEEQFQSVLDILIVLDRNPPIQTK